MPTNFPHLSDDGPKAATMEDVTVSQTVYFVGVLTILAGLNSLDRNIFSVLIPYIEKDIHLSDTQIGLLIGLGFTLLYGLSSIPLARIADTGNRRNLLSMAAGVWSAMTSATALAWSFPQLLAARAAVGAAESGAMPASQSLICDYVPYNWRARAFAALSSGMYLGLMGAYWLAPTLANYVGWRGVFLILGLPGIVVALIVRLTMREPIRGARDLAQPVERERQSLVQVVSLMWGCRPYRFLALAVFAHAASLSALPAWAPVFLVRVHGADLALWGGYLGVVMGVAPALGLVAGGCLADRLASLDAALPIRLAAAAALLTVPSSIAFIMTASPYVSIAMLGVSLTGGTFFYSYLIACMTSLMHPSGRATSQSLVSFLSISLFSGLSTLVVGLVSDQLAPVYAMKSIRYALLVPISIIPLMAILLYLASRLIVEYLHGGESRQVA